MLRSKVPKGVWDYRFVQQAEVFSQIPQGTTGRTGIEKFTGNIPDISKWLDFGLYDRVWCLNKKKPSTIDENVILGRWLAISHKIVSDMCY